MGKKKKLQQFAEIRTFPNVLEVGVEEVIQKTHANRGRWRELVFQNDKPIVLELGCGKGEYTVGLSEIYPEKNFIGVDIKGARIWRGAKTAVEENKSNAFFLRSRIEFIDSFFGPEEVDEIWITFPDPQMQERRAKKRLTSPEFISKYFSFLKPDGIIHLKTDSAFLYDYTVKVIEDLRLRTKISTDRLYAEIENLAFTDNEKRILGIRTHYETMFTKKGHSIHYIQFGR